MKYGCSKLKSFDHSHGKLPSQLKAIKPAKAINSGTWVYLAKSSTWSWVTLFCHLLTLQDVCSPTAAKYQKKASFRCLCIFRGTSRASHACSKLSSWAATSICKPDQGPCCSPLQGPCLMLLPPPCSRPPQRGGEWYDSLNRVWGYPSVSRWVQGRDRHTGMCCKTP